MDHQEWFERYKVRLNYDDDRLYGSMWPKVDWKWKMVTSALFKMAVHTLPAKERKVIELLYFEDYSERKTARKLKMSKTRLHRIKTKALKSLARSAFIKLALSPRILKRRAVCFET